MFGFILYNGKKILIDSHTRRYCAIKTELSEVPCIVHHFDSLEEAKKFAIREQTDRLFRQTHDGFFIFQKNLKYKLKVIKTENLAQKIKTQISSKSINRSSTEDVVHKSQAE